MIIEIKSVGASTTVEIAKAIGIVFVVLGHVLRGLGNAGLITPDSVWWQVDKVIYAFHMPLFFFLSGLFLRKRVLAGGCLPILSAAALSMLGPLLVWSYLQFGLQFFMSGFVNNKIELLDWLLAPFPPRQQFWFLWSLFQLTVVMALLLVLARGRSALLLLVVFAGAAALDRVGSYISWAVSSGTIVHAPFFVAGIATGGGVICLPRLSLFSGGAIFLSAIGVCLLGLESKGLSFIVAMACIYAIFIFSDQFSELLANNFFSACKAWILFIGANTMIIYLAHVIAAASVRVLFVKLGLAYVGLHVLIGVLAGVFLPLLLVPCGLKLQQWSPFLSRVFLPVRARGRSCSGK